MSSSAGHEYLVGRLLDAHPVFTSAKARMTGVLKNRPHISFDSLIIESRTPARTALLVIRHLYRARQVTATGGQLAIASRSIYEPNPFTIEATNSVAQGPLSPWYERYINAVRRREEPGLLWGQRKLIPDSAIDRAMYVMSFQAGFGSPSGYVFLGDDDLVSPLVAAASDWPVKVIDIDRAVVDGAIRVAMDLGGQLTALHADLSAGSESREEAATIVVCDPFPSADGSFEEMFWRKASNILQRGGLLITTAAPSHKPEQYAHGALSLLPELGFQLIDLRANFGRYELFGFELAAVELDLLRELDITCTVSHTKSLLAARYLGTAHESNFTNIDFAKWSAATQSHYLTTQAGIQQQLDIVKQRGPANHTNAIDAVQETNQSIRARSITGRSSTSSISAAGDPFGDAFSEAERNSLRNFMDASTGIDANSGWLDLALRAIESWNRLRFDV